MKKILFIATILFLQSSYPMGYTARASQRLTPYFRSTGQRMFSGASSKAGDFSQQAKQYAKNFIQSKPVKIGGLTASALAVGGVIGHSIISDPKESYSRIAANDPIKQTFYEIEQRETPDKFVISITNPRVAFDIPQGEDFNFEIDASGKIIRAFHGYEENKQDIFNGWRGHTGLKLPYPAALKGQKIEPAKTEVSYFYDNGGNIIETITFIIPKEKSSDIRQLIANWRNRGSFELYDLKKNPKLLNVPVKAPPVDRQKNITFSDVIRSIFRR